MTGNREARASGDRLHSFRRGPDNGRRGTRYEAGHNIDGVPKITEASISARVPADGMRRSLGALTFRSEPVGPSSAGPGRTLFGLTTHADLKVGATTAHRPIGSRVRPATTTRPWD